jgi:hypothetical protein
MEQSERKTMRTRSLAVMALVGAFAASALAADPFIGTWKLNLAKSRFKPGPALRSETIKSEAQDNGQKTTFDGIDANGKAYHVQGAPKYDGKDYPITGDPDADTVALRKIDRNTCEWVTKKAGKEAARGRSIVSRDGKTMTDAQIGKDGKGREYTNILVYDRQ